MICGVRSESLVISNCLTRHVKGEKVGNQVATQTPPRGAGVCVGTFITIFFEVLMAAGSESEGERGAGTRLKSCYPATLC